MNVIYIVLGVDLPTSAQNALRYAIELGRWRAKWRRAQRDKDYDAMDRLQVDFERVGLP